MGLTRGRPDDDSYLGSKCGDVGQISLKIWRIEYGGITHAPLQVTTFITSLDKKIHERSKKAGGHQIQQVYRFFFAPLWPGSVNYVTSRLGEEKATPPHAAIGYRVLDRDPWVTFEFKYRPLGRVPISAQQRHRSTPYSYSYSRYTSGK